MNTADATEYKIIERHVASQHEVELFEDDVNKALKNGFFLHGYLQTSAAARGYTVYSQAMIKNTPEKGKAKK